MTNQQPRPDDAVLGGQNQAPIDAAVLGGIQGIRQKLASDNEDAKREGILQALNYGEKGIEALFGILEQEKSLNIQFLAYKMLEEAANSINQLDKRSWWGKLWSHEEASEDFGRQIKARIKSQLKNYFGWYDYKSVTVNRQGEIIQRTPGRARYYREDLGDGVYLDMTYIAGGSFQMGAPESEDKSEKYERPQHIVTVPEFWLGKYQVTQVQWQAVMGNNPAYFKDANLPVEKVSWDMCQEFCRKLSERTGRQYRLPSEAEWEYACRAGTIMPFSCGETITTDLANYSGDRTYGKDCIYAEERKGQYRKQTVKVGSFPPNSWGLYDMHGNVWEWCEDGWHENYQGAPIDASAWVDNCSQYNSRNNKRVVRGGSWGNISKDSRSAARYYANGGYIVNGLRLVLSSGRT